MHKIVRLLMILGMVSMLSAQSSITVKNSVIGYAEVGDTVSWSKPILFSYVKSDDSKWFATFFWGPTWNDEKIYIEELFYKPYSVANGGKFNIGFGQQLVPFGSDYASARVSYEIANQFVALSVDNQERQSIDVSGLNDKIEYIAEYSLSDEYYFARAVIKPGLYGFNLLAGYESFPDKEAKPLYGVMWTFDGDYPGSFLSVEFGNEGDLLFKINADLGILKLGDSKNE